MKNILVAKGQSLKIIDLNDVMYFSIVHRIVTAHCVDGNFEFYSSMKELTEQLPETVFMRVSRELLVSFMYIREFKQNVITLKNGEVLEISIRKIAAIREWIINKYDDNMVKESVEQSSDDPIKSAAVKQDEK